MFDCRRILQPVRSDKLDPGEHSTHQGNRVSGQRTARKGYTMKSYHDMQVESAALGEMQDCGVITLSLTTGVDYSTAWNALDEQGRKAMDVTYPDQMGNAYDKLGFKLERIEPYQPNGCRYTPKTIGKAYPVGSYWVYVSGHYFALANGKVMDWPEL